MTKLTFLSISVIRYEITRVTMPCELRNAMVRYASKGVYENTGFQRFVPCKAASRGVAVSINKHSTVSLWHCGSVKSWRGAPCRGLGLLFSTCPRLSTPGSPRDTVGRAVGSFVSHPRVTQKFPKNFTRYHRNTAKRTKKHRNQPQNHTPRAK